MRSVSSYLRSKLLSFLRLDQLIQELLLKVEQPQPPTLPPSVAQHLNLPHFPPKSPSLTSKPASDEKDWSNYIDPHMGAN